MKKRLVALVYTLALALLVVSCGRQFPYQEVLVFVDGDQADSQTIRTRLRFLAEVGQFYNTTNRGEFSLSIFTVGREMKNARPIFRSRANRYNPETGQFDPIRFSRQYMLAARGVHDRDVIGTIGTIRQFINNEPSKRILVIYVSDMVHRTSELDTSWDGVGTNTLDYDSFREEYESYVGEPESLAGASEVDVIIRTVTADFGRADSRLPELWQGEIFEHLGAGSSALVAGHSLSELLARIQ